MASVNLQEQGQEKRRKKQKAILVQPERSDEWDDQNKRHDQPRQFTIIQSQKNSNISHALPSDIVDFLESMPLLQCSVDFTKPDGLRTRCFLIEARRIYVCEYYLSVWSPIFRSIFFPNDASEMCEGKDEKTLVIPNAKFANMLELLECIYPQEKPITDQNIYRILALAYEYQCDEILRRCTDFLKKAPLKHMDKIVLADRFRLDDLLGFCLRQIRHGSGQLDFYSNQYERLSDRTKVQILEKLHQIKASEGLSKWAEAIDQMDIEEITPKIIANRLSRFSQKSELHFSVLRSKSGRHYYCNPYYLAAWSRLLADEVLSFNRIEFDCPDLNDEEIVNFLLCTHPPFIKLTDSNIGHVLMASCKLESSGLIRRCVMFLLSQESKSEIIEKLFLLDKCFLHELFDACLKCGIRDLNEALRLSVASLYDCLSSKAKASILDRISSILKITPNNEIDPARSTVALDTHFCTKCRKKSPCNSLKWLCSYCGSYCAEVIR